MLTQKLYKSGNSIAVTIPKELLKELKLKVGSEVVVESTPDETGLVIRKTSKRGVFLSALTPEFKSWLDEVNSKYGPALKELAKK